MSNKWNSVTSGTVCSPGWPVCLNQQCLNKFFSAERLRLLLEIDKTGLGNTPGVPMDTAFTKTLAVQELLVHRIFGNAEPPLEYTEAWLLGKFNANDALVTMKKQKHLGFTHPERPFAVSSVVVVLETASDVEALLDVNWGQGHEWPRC